MALIGDGKLAVAQSVPKLDSAVAGTRDNLTIVGREGDREDVVAVAYEATGCSTSCEFPQAEGLIPGGREGVGAV